MKEILSKEVAEAVEEFGLGFKTSIELLDPYHCSTVTSGSFSSEDLQDLLNTQGESKQEKEYREKTERVDAQQKEARHKEQEHKKELGNILSKDYNPHRKED